MKTTDLIRTYSGIFGNQVILHNRGGKIIMTIRQPRPAKDPTEKQLAWRRKFRLAARYAVNILKDPAMLAVYSEKVRSGLTPYNVALRDFLTPPFVGKLDLSGYQGNPGERISVVAGDDFMLTEVTVTITGKEGITIEQGPCVFNTRTGNYDYTATRPVPDPAGVTIFAVARDIPGHAAELSVTLAGSIPVPMHNNVIRSQLAKPSRSIKVKEK